MGIAWGIWDEAWAAFAVSSAVGRHLVGEETLLEGGEGERYAAAVGGAVQNGRVSAVSAIEAYVTPLGIVRGIVWDEPVASLDGQGGGERKRWAGAFDDIDDGGDGG